MQTDRTQRCALIQELATRRIRLTAQRKVLIDTIQEAEGHLDAATLLQLARKRDRNIDKATVYRTLRLLKRLGLVDELDLMHLTGEKHFYEARSRRSHLHLACFQCGHIEEFSSRMLEKLQSEITQQSGFRISVIRIEAGGLCKRCAARQDLQKSPGKFLSAHPSA